MPELFTIHPCLLFTCAAPSAREDCSIAHVQPQWNKRCLASRYSPGQEAAVGCSLGKHGAVVARVGGSNVQWGSAVPEKFRRTAEREGGSGVVFHGGNILDAGSCLLGFCTGTQASS